MPLPGLAAVLGIMAGTFVLLTTVGFVTIRAGGRVRSARKEGKSRRAVHQGLGVLGGVLIVMAGVALAMLYYPAYGR
jgi:ABC-type nickel/cobalt efflux system permease component RcnA